MKKKSKLKLIFFILFIIVSLVISIFLFFKSRLNLSEDFLSGKLSNENQKVTFIIEEGFWPDDTMKKLEEVNIIKDAEFAILYNKVLKYTFTAGYYEIPIVNKDGKPMNLNDLLSYLANSDNAKSGTVSITFYEDDFISDFAEKIANNTTVTKEEIMAYWNNPEVIRSYMKEYPFLTEEMFNENVKIYFEGYLFPDTYEFYEYTNPDQITRTFLNRGLEIYQKYQSDFASSKLSIHQVYTLASICQWESGNRDDMCKIAGVFLNRMDIDEVLGSTVTACYAFDLTKEECASSGDNYEYTQQYHIYNTYTVLGLPPGPVLCPGEDAIYAALHADQEAGYYYFIGDLCYGTGTVFAKTFAEHESNISKYILCE